MKARGFGDYKVSIIIAVYNAEKFLPGLYDNLAGQTYQNWEAVAVNDGSTDNSQNLLYSFSQKDKRFLWILQPNSGVSAARNAGLRAATGDFIVFLDADDRLAEDFLEKGMSVLLNNGGDAFFCLFCRGSSPCFDVKTKGSLLKIADPLLFFLKNKRPKLPVTVWGKIYKKEALAGLFFNEAMKNAAEDYLFTLRFLFLAKNISFSRQKLYFYRVNPESLTQKPFDEPYIDDHILLLTESLFFGQKALNDKMFARLERRMCRTVFRAMVLMPFYYREDYLAFWAHYREKLLCLIEDKSFDKKYLKFTQRVLTGLFLRGNFSLLQRMLKIFNKRGK